MAQLVKNPPAVRESWVQSLGWEDPWRRKRLPTPVFLLENSHGEKSLEGYSPWAHKESDMSGQLSTAQGVGMTDVKMIPFQELDQRVGT